jgi:hypothetical protein
MFFTHPDLLSLKSKMILRKYFYIPFDFRLNIVMHFKSNHFLEKCKNIIKRKTANKTFIPNNKNDFHQKIQAIKSRYLI